MTISLSIKANDISKVPLYHPNTRECVGNLLIAGPDHEATKAWRREINNRRQKRDYKQDLDAEVRESLRKRTVGWEGVKNSESGEDAPFDHNALSELFIQDWLVDQVLTAINEESFFFKE